MANKASASTVYSDSYLLDELLFGAARAMFTSAYADYCQDQLDTEGSCDLPQAANGEDWFDFAPDPPPAAYAYAGRMLLEIEHANPQHKAGIYSIASAAADADGVEPDAEQLGHYLAMQYMGRGVSWFDDHEKFPLKVPYREVSFFNFDPNAFV